MAKMTGAQIEELLADVLAREVFIRSQGWSEWPTLEQIQADAPAIIKAMGEATGWGGFDGWHEGTTAALTALLDAIQEQEQASCAHDSLDGVDQAPDGPEKVWKCCTCGQLVRYVMNDDGWTGRYEDVT